MAEETTADGATAKLTQFVHDARFADLLESTRHAATRALVNIIGCCLSGAKHEIVETAARALLPLAGAGTASLLGRVERTDVLTATLLNCLASAAYSFDDTHADTILHPSGAVATALLALAEQQPMSGEDFLLAFVLGVDTA
jgi:2-methylcitrate dehydratase PrpD